MTEYGMGDEKTIDEILDDVDTDKVTLPPCFRNLICCGSRLCLLVYKFFHEQMQDGTINFEEFVNMMRKGTTDSDGKPK